MRKLFFIAVIIISIQNSFGQLAFNDRKFLTYSSVNSDIPLKSPSIPDVVKKAWQKDYASVKEMKWYQTPQGFMACYEFNKFESRVVYDANGGILMHSREIDYASVPDLISNFVRKKYPGSEVKIIYMNYPVKGQNVYEVQVGDSAEFFDVNGNNIGNKISLQASK